MTTQSPPIVSLQAPKDVSIDVIEQELRDIWQSYNNNEDGMAATRATTFSFIVYEPDAVQELLTLLGYYTGPIDGIAGPRTYAAIKVAQKDLGLEITGLSSDEFVAGLRAAWEAEKNAEDGANHRQYAADLDAIGVADAIAASNPCRIITLCPTAEADEGVKASVSAYCPVNKRSQNTLV
ncbi:MAG: peptidoglycan-binding protein, partial [Microcystis aeruginosa]